MGCVGQHAAREKCASKRVKNGDLFLEMITGGGTDGSGGLH